ncbi:MAG: hypothetical protein K2J32_00865 [Ruminococcus sp.]|nr:hypothetical protein [Ruminococcus sp.]
MKKSKILIAGVFAVAVCGMLTACGKGKEEVVEETKPTMYAVKKDLYGNDDASNGEEVTEQSDISETAEDDEESGYTEETAEQETAGEMTEEKAVELCQKAYDALSSAEDMAEIAQTCDMELYYYFETGELVNDIEELTAYSYPI